MLHKKQRTGITLLFVVSLIVLFMLLATTFLVVSSQYLRSAKSYSEGEIFTVDPVNELDQAFYILLRDTTDVNCPIRGQSLLADIYGLMKGFRGNITGATYQVDQPNQHVVVLTVANTNPITPGGQTFGIQDNLLPGRAITITSGRAKGLTGRVVANNMTEIAVMFERANFDREAVNQTSDFLAALTDAEFLVNGPAFQGKGAGFDPGAAATDPAYTAEALNPNRTGDSATVFQANYFGSGDLNETWDAPDYQNVWLSGQVAGIFGGNYVSFDLPSFYRPNLGANNNFRALPTPLTPDNHPNAPMNWMEYDVDNDGDLRKDSIFVDFNLPVMTDDTGRTYKRLFAVLIRDMDGRLNLNAHSNRFHLDSNLGGGVPLVVNPNMSEDEIAYQAIAGNSENRTNFSEDGLVSAFPKGQGWGPPEVNMRTVLNSVQLDRLMRGWDADGDGTIDIAGRNGFDGGAAPPNPGFVDNNGPFPGFAGGTGSDPVEGLHFYQVPSLGSYFEKSYGTFWDIHGRCTFGHDYNGQPRFGVTTVPAIERVNTEYERNLDARISHGSSSLASTDMPFTYGEMEQILRSYDTNAVSLPSRINDLLPGVFNGNSAFSKYLRTAVTTHSYDVPTPPTDLREYLAGLGLNLNQVGQLLPKGILFGSKMDINFPFGNGLDDNGNGIVDESWGPLYSDYLNADRPGRMPLVDESYIGENFPNDYYNVAGIVFDHDGDGDHTTNNDGDNNGDVDAHQVRIRYARHLYVLAHIFFRASGAMSSDTAAIPDVNNDGNVNNDDLCQWLAQWAINVVDFRDADSIMTPFEYDTNPFNGWGVDGNPNTVAEPERGVVFGCERPELLLTESFCYHDRRTEDRDDDDNEEETTTEPMNPDDDFDQRLVPFGGMMLELFNPQSAQTRATPDIYGTVGGVAGVDLTKVSTVPENVTDGGGNNHLQQTPVWRLVITESDFDLDNPQDQNYQANDIERVVYFVPLTDYGSDHTRLRYGLPFTPTANNLFTPTSDVRDAMRPVGFLRTAVVGTGQFIDPGDTTNYLTPLGRRTDADETTDLLLAETRGFVLDAGNRQLTLREYDGANVVDLAVRSTEVIPIENLNISEPDNGYMHAGFTRGNITVVDGTYGNLTDTRLTDGGMPPKSLDTPLDKMRFQNNGTQSRYRYVYLQRLANPLVGWDQQTNPYRTVDSLALDLHVFNGADNAEEMTANNFFGTRERGEGSVQRLLWRDPDNNINTPAIAAAGDNHFHSFFLEDEVNAARQGRHEETLGETIFNNGYTTIINDSYDYIGNPGYADGIDNNGDGNTDEAGEVNLKEYASLPWNNRPFISQYELMLVPQTRSSQLLEQFSTAGPDNYTGATPNGRYGHLMNFFKTTTTMNAAANLYQIFDYVHVPSRFTGASGILQPDLYSTNSDTFKAPHNVVPSFREPGRINLNTIFNPQVFSGLKGGNYGYGGHHGDFNWVQFKESRRGAAGDTFDPSANSSFFSNAFRSGSDGNLAPNPAQVRTGADASLLRSTSVTNAGAMTASYTDNRGLLNSPTIATGNRLHSPDRHPYLRYKNRIRLGNMGTTRSNVFAIWITVGYFEYDETTNTIGAELGKESGNVERHRAFYMVDRSIPVGFEPGKNHNVDQAVMIRRYIE